MIASTGKSYSGKVKIIKYIFHCIGLVFFSFVKNSLALLKMFFRLSDSLKFYFVLITNTQ